MFLASRGHHRTNGRKKIVAAVIAFVFLSYLAIYSPIFSIRNVIVVGNQAVMSESIISAVNEEMKGRRWLIFPKQNILFFDALALYSRLRDPRLDTVKVTGEPRGVLKIFVTEKQSIARWEVRGRTFEIDKRGRIISEMGTLPPTIDNGILVLTNKLNLSDFKVGDEVILADTLAGIKNFNDSLDAYLNLSINLYDLSEAGQGKIIAETKDGWKLYFSATADPHQQLSKLRAFVQDRNLKDANWQEKTDYIDVRFGSTRIYFK